MKHKMISLFSGSGGFELCANLCGIEPIACSEIEPFPIRVTTKRFPNMKHLGDITTIKGSELEPVDLITGGSPCQDMSVAGKRQGMSKQCPKCGYKDVANIEHDICPECGAELEYTRSGLFMEQIRIIKEMREEDELRKLRSGRTNEHIRPRFMLWENVVGAFSSNKGEDFRAVLEETARVKDKTAVIPRPPKAKWNNSGCIMGDGWSIAWRVLDAQFWGVPQRRRRIALVADFGSECAGEILFKRDGLQRNFTESRFSWKGIAGNIAESVGEAGEYCTIGINGSIAGTLDANYYKGCGERNGVEREVVLPKKQYAVDFGRTADRIQMNATKSVTLQDGGGGGCKTGLYCMPKNLEQKVYGICSYGSNSMKSDNPHSGIYEANTSRTLDLNGGNPACNQGGIAIVENKSYSLQGNMIGRADNNGPQGDGVNEEKCFTLNTTDRHAVATFRSTGFADYSSSSSGTLKASGGDLQGGSESLVVQHTYQDTSGPLMANSHPGSYSGQDAYNDMFVADEYIVRRLTPLECSRLQGFPDFWLDGLETENPTEEDLAFWREVFETHRKVVTGASKAKSDKQIIKWLKNPYSDGAAYKLWGNGIALPCFLCVMEGIKEVLERTSNKITSSNDSPKECHLKEGGN